MEEISALGWVKPEDTGLNSSNCLINDLGIAVHHKKHGFNPYVLEISEQVRYGLMDKEKAIKKANAIPDFSEVQEQAKQIGLNTDDV